MSTWISRCLVQRTPPRQAEGPGRPAQTRRQGPVMATLLWLWRVRVSQHVCRGSCRYQVVLITRSFFAHILPSLPHHSQDCPPPCPNHSHPPHRPLLTAFAVRRHGETPAQQACRQLQLTLVAVGGAVAATHGGEDLSAGFFARGSRTIPCSS